MEICNLRDHPSLAGQAAAWFHAKWGIPLETYAESIRACLSGEERVPQWYVAVDAGRIAGGLGVIENDFHDRKDLSPNVCAVYVEERCRRQGIAGALLRHACEDMSGFGVRTLYLVTDHTSFYERYGWRFLCMVRETGGDRMARMYVHRQKSDCE